MYRLINKLSIMIAVSLTAVLLSGCGSFYAGNKDEEKLVSDTGFYFDTVIQLSIVHDNGEVLLDECFLMCQELENIFSKTKELIQRIKKITVFPNKTLEIEFDKLKIMSLISVYTDKLLDEEITDKFTKITITYEHKFKVERDRANMNAMVLEYLRCNSEAKLKDIVKLSGKSESYVNKTIKILKDAGLLRYERYGNHTGRWIVTEQKK